MKTRIVSMLPALFLLLAQADRTQAGILLGDQEDSLEIRGRLRAFYNYRFEEPYGEREDNRFALDQARLGVRGRVASKYRFELEMELAEGEVEATDLWGGYEPADWLLLKIGQLKVPYSRERMTSKDEILFTGRPGLIQDFLPGRDIGAMCRGRLWDKRLEFYGGVFTGNGPNQFKDDGKGSPLLAFRTAFSPLGRFRYREGDLERSPRPLFSVGLNLAWSDDAGLDPEGYLRTIEGEKLLYGADAAFKYRGFFIEGEVHHANFSPASGMEFKAGGFMVQAAYLLLPPWVEIACRYDEFNPSDRTRGDTQRTVTYGLNLYLHGQRAKVQVDYFQNLDLDLTQEKWQHDEFRVLFQLAI